MADTQNTSQGPHMEMALTIHSAIIIESHTLANDDYFRQHRLDRIMFNNTLMYLCSNLECDDDLYARHYDGGSNIIRKDNYIAKLYPGNVKEFSDMVLKIKKESSILSISFGNWYASYDLLDDIGKFDNRHEEQEYDCVMDWLLLVYMLYHHHCKTTNGVINGVTN